jgi:large subunit ribosomal protein L10
MDNPRPQKVAVVTEVRARLDAAEAAILTEYRGLSVAELASLRRALRAAGGDYKVYKNTLVKLAISGGRHEALAPLLEGPTAIAFVTGEVSAAAKALRDYARTYPSLVIKGGLHAEGYLSAQDLQALADLPSRDVLLSQLAGTIAAPLRQLAGLLQALPRNLAYGLSALLDERGGPPVETAAPEATPDAAAVGATDEPAEGAPPTETAEAAPPTETAEAAPLTETATAEAPEGTGADTGDADMAAPTEAAPTETDPVEG